MAWEGKLFQRPCQNGKSFGSPRAIGRLLTNQRSHRRQKHCQFVGLKLLADPDLIDPGNNPTMKIGRIWPIFLIFHNPATDHGRQR